MKKRLFCLALTIVMVFSALPAPVFAEESLPDETEPVETTPVETEPVETEPVETEPVETEPVETEPVETEPVETEPVETEPVPEDPDLIASGVCGENACWTLDKDGVLTISGTGPMGSYSSTDLPWKDYENQVLHAVIEDGITTICDYAFFSNDSILSLTMADSVTELGYRFCENCTNLASVKLSANITSIPFCAFNGTALTEIDIPEGVTSIGKYAFSDCKKLSSVTLPDTLTTLSGGMNFEDCVSLTHIELPDGLTSISQYAFSGSGLVEIDIPSGVTELSLAAFRDCASLKRVSLPDTLTLVAADVFMDCASLEEVFIPDCVADIHASVFENCPNLTIHTYLFTAAHIYAANYDIPVEILEDEPDTVYYPIYVLANDGGSVAVAPESSPANRYVFLEVAPSENYYIDTIYYYLNTDQELELQYEWVSDTMMTFFMPACEVGFEISFILNESPFTDVDADDYYYQPVLWAVSNNITSGVSANRFGPNNSCTRAQVVTFLWRTAGSPDPESGVNPFTDVSEDAYYYKAVLWAVENGITSGVSANQFGPNNVCTRAQVVTFLWRAVGSPNPPSDYNPFTDVKETDYYYNAVLFAVQYGITSGVSDTRFGSGNTCTRAHVVTFLYKTFHG